MAITADLLPPAGTHAAVPAGGGWPQLLMATTARAILFTLFGMMFWSAAPSLAGWIPTTVLSDSMAPLIRSGDVVVSQPIAPTSLRPGQILLIEDPDHPGRLRLHRFTDVTADGELITKGDANPTPDSTSVTPDAVRGVGYIRIPFVGLPIVWLHEQRWALVAAVAAGLFLLMWASGSDRSLRRLHELPPPRRWSSSARPTNRRSAFATSRAVIPAALGFLLAGCLMISGGAGAAFSSSTVSPPSTLSTLTYPCLDRTPANSPYLYYAFNEESGKSAVDSSGNGRTGTLITGATREGGNCTANASPTLSLNGTSGQVTTSALINAPTVFTIATWFQTSTITGGKLIGFGNFQSGTSSQYDRQIYMTNAGKIVFGVYNNGSHSITSANSYNDGDAHYVAATLSSSGMTLYVDGTRVGTNTSARTAEPNRGYWRIGYDNTSGWPSAPTSNYFRGDMDNTAIYLTALTATQIAAEYAKGT